MKNFISILDYSKIELIDILDRADILADAWNNNCMPQSMKNKQIALWFYGQGFRNRVAFEVGARAMGASVSYIPGELGVHEPLEDIGHYLDKWFDIIVIRAKSHKDLCYLADNTTATIINARTDFNHPCEIMGDLQFIRKQRGSLEGLKVTFVGEVTNLCMSWFEAAARLPILVTQVAPINYLANKKILSSFNSNSVGKITVTNKLDSLLPETDLLYTDCWPKSENMKEIEANFLPYQITGERVTRLHKKSVFLPCPPVTRGQEVSAEAMDSDYCMNYQAKEFLLHTQNAIMEMALCL